MKLSLTILIVLLCCLCVPFVHASFPPPEANFISDTTNGCIYETITFTDTSYEDTGGVTWFWLFGDSQDSHLQNPTHYYDTPGTYTVSLEITDFWGTDTETKINYITVRDCYTADFSANKTCDIGSPRVVNLNGTCSSPLGKTSWEISPNESWSYWDGTGWHTDFDGVWNGDATGDLNATVNFTSYGAYTITHVCNYAPPIGLHSETKTDYILIGVNGTYCSSGGICSVYVGDEDTQVLCMIAIGLAALASGLCVIAMHRKKITI